MTSATAKSAMALVGSQPGSLLPLAVMLTPRVAGLRLRRERNGSRSGECHRERSEDAEVGVQLDSGESAHPERREAVLVLQPAEGALDGQPSTGAGSPADRPLPGHALQARPDERDPGSMSLFRQMTTQKSL